MKLKLLFFMGFLSVLCNTVNAINGGPIIPKPVSLPPTISANEFIQQNIASQVTCPGVIVANIVFYIDDDQTIFPSLIVTATSDNQSLLPDANLAIYGVSQGDRFITVTPISGQLGDANVTITVEDGDGQKTSTTFRVTTQDSAPPTLTGVSNKNENVDSACEFSIPDYTILTTASDDCLAPTVTQSPLAGTVISTGHNTQQLVTLTATDSVGKTATTSFTVTLIDDIDPVITCNGDVNQNQDIGVCSAVVSFPDPIITDNCSATWIQTAGLASGSVFPVGTTTNTFVATDEAGNTSSCSFNVIVSDIILPTVATQPKTIYLDSAGNATITATDIDNGSLDNCAIDSKVLDITSFTCANVGPNTVILTVTDTSGNVASATAVVTVVDNEKPVITTSGNQTLFNALGQCGANVTVSATSTDNCLPMTNTPSSLRSDSLLLSDAYPVGTTTITWTVTDNNGNSASTTQTVTVNDNEKPVITTSGNQNVSNDLGQCGANVTVSATSTDNCLPMTNTPSSLRSDSLLLTDLFPVGTTTITWTVVDNNGNSASTTQTVTVNDAENPVAVTQNITVELDNTGNATISVLDIESGSTDNCGIVASLSSLDITSFDCDDLGANTIVLTVEDAAGNTDTENATVTVVDKILPTIMTSGPIAIGTDDDVCVGTTTVVPATATDNCSVGSPTWVRSDSAVNLNDPFQKGETTITWSVTDVGGNVASATQTVTVTDDQAPVFSSSFPDLIVDNDVDTCGYLTSQLTIPSVSDNCTPFDGVVSVSPAFIPVSAGPDHIPSIVTWSATDDAGNTVTATQNVTVQDLELPVMRTKNITLYYDANGQIIITPQDIDDGSTDNSGTDCFTKYVVPNILYCGDKGDNSVILTGTDLWGNQHYKEATVTAVDNTNPTISAPATVTLNTNTACTWVGTLVSPTTADNCSVISVTNDAPSALPLGDTTVTWTVTDASGNTATTTQLVTVNDIEKPVAIAKLGVVVELDTNGDATITALDIDNSSTDNCGIVASLSTVTPSTFTCANVGSNVVTLSVTDESGNTSEIDTVVTVIDNLIPVIASVSPIVVNNSTGICGANLTVTAPTASDNCSVGTPVGTRSDSKALNAVYPVGTTIISWNFSDASGNAALAVTQTVDVSDNENPTITVTPITVDTNAGCIWTGTLGLPVTADNCTVVSVTSDKAADFAYPVGDTDVVWTATDAAGNTATATQTVTVSDVEKPIALTNSFSVTLDAAGEATITAAQVDNGSSDNCGIDTLAIDETDFDCSNVGENTVVLTVTDNNGNVSTANATITVVDATAPALVTKPFTATLSSTGTVSILAADVITTATDICGIKSSIVSPFQFTCANLGSNTVTVTAIDNNNNVTTSTAIVTVVDTTKPTIITTAITVDTNAGCIWTGTLGLPVTTDNCSVVSVTNDKAADFAYPVGTTTVTWTVKDASNNTETATQAVTVRDTEKPIAKATDITIKLSSLVGAGAATITVADIDNGSSDNCGIRIINGLVISKSSFDCTNVGANTVILTVTDISGNVSTANAIVTVIDDTLPVIAPVSAIGVNTSAGICGANLTVTPSATATDNCTVGTPVGTRSDAKALNALYPLGRTVITWNIKDASGNAALPVIQTVDVTDAQIPVITSNGNKTANADLGGCSAVVNASATATDNCSVGTPTGVRSDAKPLASAYPVGTTTITWNVSDVNGNAAVAVVQTVTVTDTQIPVITANGNKNFVSDFGQCGAIVAVSATATDNCSVTNPVIGTRSDAAAINALYPVGTTTITWNVTDVNGNAAAPVVQTVVVRDLQIPVINGTVVSIDANTDATACGATVSVTPPTATDNCSVGSPIGTRSDNLGLTALYPIGTTTITWKVTDVNGNAAIPTTTTVKVKDMVLPTVITQNIPVQLNVGGFVTIVPAQVNNGSTDNCGIASYSLDKVSFNCLNVGANTVTLTVIDIHGNVNFATATVTVSEPIIPIALTRNIIVQLNAAGTVSILPSDINNGSTDNCAIVSYSLSKSTFDCSNVGQNIITLTATDASGNISIPVNATVTVQDKIAPVVVTQPFTAQLDATGNVAITVANVNNGSTDACGIATYSLSKATFTCANVGSNVVTLTATDVHGNVNQAFASVLVVDSVKPVVLAKDIELVLDGISVSITPEDVFVSATDACGVDVHSYTLSRDTFTIVDVLNSPVTVTLSVTDVNGNVGTDDFLITFPTLPTVANEVITPNGDGTNDAWVIDNITNHPNSIVKVYNTWGSLVFSAKNYQNNWDGKLNGNDVTLPDGGSYYYQIDLDGNGTVEEQGWLYITRQ